MKVTPPITALTAPKGTLPVGETTWLYMAPVEPMVIEAWLVATPPRVMLLAAIVPAAKPCASMRSEVGAVPRKLKAVVWAAEL